MDKQSAVTADPRAFPNTGLTPRDVREKVLLVCGEDRLDVEAALDALQIEYTILKQCREFLTYDLAAHDFSCTLCLSGLGSASVEIALTELTLCGARAFVHSGTCGSLSDAFAVGDVVVASETERHDGASFHYLPEGSLQLADPESLAKTLDILEQSNVPFKIGRILSTDTFYAMGASLDECGDLIYPGVPLIEERHPPCKFLELKRIIESGDEYLIDMESATFYTLCSLFRDRPFYVSIKGVANMVPFIEGEQVEHTKRCLANAIAAACRIIAGLYSSN